MGPKTNFSTFSKEIRNLPPKASGANYASKEISAPNQPKPFPHSRLRSSAPGMLLARDRTVPACARPIPALLSVLSACVSRAREDDLPRRDRQAHIGSDAT